jgi:hypothetical protein
MDLPESTDIDEPELIVKVWQKTKGEIKIPKNKSIYFFI